MDLDDLWPSRAFSLPEFNKHYLRLIRDDPDDDNDVVNQVIDSLEFVLSGREVRTRRQAYVEPLQHRLNDRNIPVQRRDYDSLLGFTDNIPTQGVDLYVYPIPPPDRSLTKSIHLKVPMVSDVPEQVSAFRCQILFQPTVD
jgi:hypothetical protein